MFINLNVSEKSLLFTDVFLDIISKNISSKIITCNKKYTPWITPIVKTAIKKNATVYKKWVGRGRNPLDHDQVSEVQNNTYKLIKEVELAYYANSPTTLSDPKIGHKH